MAVAISTMGSAKLGLKLTVATYPCIIRCPVAIALHNIPEVSSAPPAICPHACYTMSDTDLPFGASSRVAVGACDSVPADHVEAVLSYGGEWMFWLCCYAMRSTDAANGGGRSDALRVRLRYAMSDTLTWCAVSGMVHSLQTEPALHITLA
eukprot:3678683-Rhodomonas_salina.1